MFQVHGLAGRLFTTRAETLRRVERVAGTAAAAPVAETDDVVLSRRVTRDATDAGEPDPQQDPPAHRAALQAYAQLQGEVPAAPARRRRPKVGEWMVQEVHRVRLDQPLGAALTMLDQHRIAQAPVVDATDQLVGLLLRHDTHGLPPTASVGAAMLTPVPATQADTDLRALSLALLNTGLAGMPVTGPQGELIGIITRADVLRAVATEPPLDLWG